MGFDYRYKLDRIRRFCGPLGLAEALALEFNLTIRRRVFAVKARDLRYPIELRYGTSDLSVLESVLLDRDCDVNAGPAPRLIIDAGANIGISTSFLASKYPMAKVVALEPDPENCQILRKNTSRFENVVVLQAGLWHSSAHLAISNPEAESWSRQVREVDTNAAGFVEGVSPLDLVERYGVDTIDAIKIDIEGSELGLFQNRPERWLRSTRVVAIESHSEEATRLIQSAAVEVGMSQSKVGEKLVLRARETPC